MSPDREPRKDDEVRPRLWLAERLFEARTILISGEIHSELAREVVAQLLAMASVSNDDITIFLHSPGGHVESADTIHDMIGFVEPRVIMVGTGWVASAGAHIYLAVPKEDRYCLPNTRFLLHQPWGGAGGRATDIGIEAEEILKMRNRLNRIIAERTGQPLKKVERDTERNFWMSAQEALEYGLVGKIVTSAAELKKR
ncbi:MAG: ATP-dependent Clp protease proteolytic subunit [Candidatus Binatia bacterium]|nr:MAG: ATP-dependent Clp protease proteolytic subunit [Candidatus Binatia bacterium]